MDVGPLRPSLPDDRRLSLGAMHPVRAHLAFIAVFVLSAAVTAVALTYVYSERFVGETNAYFKPAGSRPRLALQGDPGAWITGAQHALQGDRTDARSPRQKAMHCSVLETVIDLHLDASDVATYDGPWYRVAYQRAKDFVFDYGADAWSLLQYGRVIEDDRTNTAIRDLRKNTKVLSEDSYVFTVRTLAKTPELAAGAANDLARRLIDVINGEDQDANSRRGQQLEKLRAQKLAELATLEASIRDLLAGVNAASIDTEIEQSTSRRSKLDLQRIDAAASLRQEESRAVDFANRLRNQAPASGDARSRPIDRLGADDFSKLTSEKLAAENRAVGLRSRLEVLQRDADQLSARLQQLNLVRSESDVLSARLQSSKRDLVALTDSLQETAIEGGMAAGELRIQSPAQIPQSPVSPIKVYHVGLALVLAAVFAAGLAVLLSYLDIRLFMVGEKWRRPVATEAKAVPYEATRIDAKLSRQSSS